MSELSALMDTLGETGGDNRILRDGETAHLVASGHNILSARDVKELDVDARETPGGISAAVTVRKGIRIINPVHLCFSILHPKEAQEIRMNVLLEADSYAHFIAHCIFPNAEKALHSMEANIELGEGAEMRYSETHFHGPYGGIKVIPRASVRVGKKGRYISDFNLTTGRVGTLKIDYTVEAGEDAVSELTARIFGHGNDDIGVREKVVLAGMNSRGLIKTRIAVEDNARADVTGITEGNAAGARGHVDCMEIVKDNASARAIPVVNVSNPLAKVTHEAAIGSVDRKQLETLMAHGLSPEEAVDIIVRGMLR